jgi:poly(A) polymerase
MISKLLKWFKKDGLNEKIVPRAAHGISRQNISKNALKVLYRLNNAGFSAYLVGGCIRDLLVGKQPKDFDIATNAEPEQIQELFNNCRLIGRRFRLAHVHFGREIIEVATFRAQQSETTIQSAQGMILRHNDFGTIEEDVVRRDFTANALYYNIADFSLVDYVDALEDIKKRRLKLIGDPELRYREDPVRMLRAIRFAVKLQFHLHSATAKPIRNLAPMLAHVPAARLFEEYSKLFLQGHAFATFKMLCEYNLFERLFPAAAKYLDDPNNLRFIETGLKNTDVRYAEDKSIAPSFLIAVLLWKAVCERSKQYIKDGMLEYIAFHQAMDKILSEQQKVMSIPRRYTSMARDMWDLQNRLERKRTSKNAAQLFGLAKFRAAYDFLQLRACLGDKHIIDLANWWRSYVDGDEATREKLTTQNGQGKRKIRKKSKPKTKTAASN